MQFMRKEGGLNVLQFCLDIGKEPFRFAPSCVYVNEINKARAKSFDVFRSGDYLYALFQDSRLVWSDLVLWCFLSLMFYSVLLTTLWWCFLASSTIKIPPPYRGAIYALLKTITILLSLDGDMEGERPYFSIAILFSLYGGVSPVVSMLISNCRGF